MCPETESWYDYKYNDKLSDPDRIRMKEHLDQCAACSDFLQALTLAATCLDEDKAARVKERSAKLASGTLRCASKEDWIQTLATTTSESKRGEAYAHLTECVECREKLIAPHYLAEAARAPEPALSEKAARRQIFERARDQFVGTEPEPAARLRWAPFHWGWILRRGLPIMAMLVVLSGLGFRPAYVTYLVYKGDQELRAGFKDVRPSALRLSIDFGWSERNVRGVLKGTEQKEISDAEKALTQAWEWSPQSAKTNHALGRFYLAHKQHAQAKPYLMKALELSPPSASVHNDLGVLAYDEKNYSEALRYFNQAMRLDPNYAQPVFNAAFLQVHDKKDAAAAKPLIERYRKLDPKSDWMYDLERELERLTIP